MVAGSIEVISPLFSKSWAFVIFDTASYTPESNGRAERLNRVINEAARAMLIHGFLMSMLFYRESHITRWSIYKRFSPLDDYQ